MKTLVVSPHYYPMEDGVGHYTTFFIEELMRRGEEVSVLTSESNSAFGNELIWEKVNSWHGISLLRLLLKLRKSPFDKILIQYVPFMYARRAGINFTLVLFCLLTKLFTASRLQVMFHELHYPFRYNPKEFFMFLCHHIMLFGIGAVSDDLFVSTGRFKAYLERVFPGRKAVLLEVGSNIPRLSSGLSDIDDVLDLCLFGSLHPSKEYPRILSVLKSLKRPWRAKFIGMTEEKAESAFGALIKGLPIRFLGHLSGDEIAKIFNRSDALVVYYVDGVSTRRGSSLAALNNGLPLITTKTEYTDDIFYQLPQVHLLPNDGKVFEKELSSLLEKFKPISVQERVELEKEFDKTFSWNKIIDKYLMF